MAENNFAITSPESKFVTIENTSGHHLIDGRSSAKCAAIKTISATTLTKNHVLTRVRSDEPVRPLCCLTEFGVVFIGAMIHVLQCGGSVPLTISPAAADTDDGPHRSL